MASASIHSLLKSSLAVPSSSIKKSGVIRHRKRQLDDDPLHDIRVKRDAERDAKRSIVNTDIRIPSTLREYTYEVEDLQEFLVNSIEYYIKDVDIDIPVFPPSLLELVEKMRQFLLSQVSEPPIYFRKWMIDQKTNVKLDRILIPVSLTEIKNIGLYDYYIDESKPIKEGGVPLNDLLQFITMYLLTLRTGDLSIVPDMISKIWPLVN